MVATPGLLVLRVPGYCVALAAGSWLLRGSRVLARAWLRVSLRLLVARCHALQVAQEMPSVSLRDSDRPKTRTPPSPPKLHRQTSLQDAVDGDSSGSGAQRALWRSGTTGSLVGTPVGLVGRHGTIPPRRSVMPLAGGCCEKTHAFSYRCERTPVHNGIWNFGKALQLPSWLLRKDAQNGMPLALRMSKGSATGSATIQCH